MAALAESAGSREEQILDIEILMHWAETLIRQAAKFFNLIRLVSAYPFEEYLATRTEVDHPFLRCDVGPDIICITELVSAGAATDPDLADAARTNIFKIYDAYELLTSVSDYRAITTEAGLEGSKRCFYVEALITRLTSEDEAFPASVFGPYQDRHAHKLLSLFQAMNALQGRLCYLMTSFRKAERLKAEGHIEIADIIYTTLKTPMTETYEGSFRLIATLGSILDPSHSPLEAGAAIGTDFSSQCDDCVRLMYAETSRIAVSYIISAAQAALFESKSLFEASMTAVEEEADFAHSAEAAAAFAATDAEIAASDAGRNADRHLVGSAAGALKRSTGFYGEVPRDPSRPRRGSIFGLVFGSDVIAPTLPPDPNIKCFIGLLLLKALNAFENVALSAIGKAQLKRDIEYLNQIYDQSYPESKLRGMLYGLLTSQVNLARTEPIIATVFSDLQLLDERGALTLPFTLDRAEEALPDALRTYLEENGFVDDPMVHASMQTQLKKFFAAEAEAAVPG